MVRRERERESRGWGGRGEGLVREGVRGLTGRVYTSYVMLNGLVCQKFVYMFGIRVVQFLYSTIHVSYVSTTFP